MSKRIRKVIIGTTLEETSFPAIEAGLDVARVARAKVHLVHAVVPPQRWAGNGFLSEQPGDGWTAELARQEERIALQVRALGISDYELAGTTVAPGSPHRVLLDTAREVGAELIVVGASETGGALDRALGSTADRMVRNATWPVLVVRDTLSLPPSRVLLPVDLSALSADAFRCGLALVRELAGTTVPDLEALFVITDRHRPSLAAVAGEERVRGAARVALEAFVTRYQTAALGPVRAKLAAGVPEPEIIQEAGAWGADLVVVGTHGAGGFEPFTIGSVAAGLARHAPCSVLVIPPEAALKEAIHHEANGRAAAIA
jgi:nucleotide-binding universal stress UspA family protein